MYGRHWQIEIFFRWVKQNLKFTLFYGEEENPPRSCYSELKLSYVVKKQNGVPKPSPARALRFLHVQLYRAQWETTNTAGEFQ
jgi:hypothetical protein